MEKKKLRFYRCPTCGIGYAARLSDLVNERMIQLFPYTYARGKMTCLPCLKVKLANIKQLKEQVKIS